MTASLLSTLAVILLSLWLGEIAAKLLVDDVPPDRNE